MKRFSHLDNLHVASPCDALWSDMEGDERKRFCGDCKLHVFNLSGMTRKQAEDLLKNSEGRLCVRFYRRADGTILTQDCPVGLARAKAQVRKAWAWTTAKAAGVLAVILGPMMLRSPQQGWTQGVTVEVTGTPSVEVMGDVASPTESMMMGRIATPREFVGLTVD